MGESEEGKKEEEGKKQETREEVPEEIVLKVDMHCEACARKVERSLRGFEGVDDVKTDYKDHKVVVKGKNADPVKLCERVQKKSGRKVEIISPLPKPPEEEKKKDDKGKLEEKKEEPPPVITVILNIRMHCDACAQVLQKRIRKIDGVQSVAADMSSDQVIVKSVLEPTKLVENVYKRTRKHASIVKEEEKKEEEKKGDGSEKKEEEGKGENKNGDENEGEDGRKADAAKRSEYWPPLYFVEYAYPPQIFSDENPHACHIM